jgi:WD40 repeat protein
MTLSLFGPHDVTRMPGGVFCHCLFDRLHAFGVGRVIELRLVGARASFLILEGHTDNVKCLTFPARDGLFSGSLDGTVRRWSTEHEGMAAGWVADLGAWVLCVACTSLGEKEARLVAGCADNNVHVLSAADGAALAVLKGHSAPVTGVWAAGVGSVVSGSGDGTVRMWDISTACGSSSSSPVRGAVSSLAVSANKKFLCVGCELGSVLLFDLCVMGEVWSAFPVVAGENTIRSVAFSQSGLFIATGDDLGVVKVLSAKTGAVLRSMHGHTAPVNKADFVGRSHVISVSHDSTVRSWPLFPRITRAVTSLWSAMPCTQAITDDINSLLSFLSSRIDFALLADLPQVHEETGTPRL